MTPRPIYKWKTFWLGILVLGFIGWAWERSQDSSDSLAFGFGGDFYEIAASNGSITAARYYGIAPGRGIHSVEFTSDTGVGFSSGVGDEDDRKLAPAFKVFSFDEGGSLRGFRIADWLLLLLILVPWSALLAWRWWRQRKRMRQQRALTKSPDLTS